MAKGMCPLCGKALVYGEIRLPGAAPAVDGFYAVECSSKRCLFVGKEFYCLEYVCTAEAK